ncbi:MAG: sugar transferase [Erysipelotrichaceae bacterium]|nr:sugar transferase [Erysipelotrichaceae bacterium]
MYHRCAKGWLKHLDFMIVDILCLHLSFLLAYIIRFGMFNPYLDYIYRNLIIVITLIAFVSLIFFNGFKNVLKRGYYKEFLASIKHVTIVIVFTTFYLFAIQDGLTYSRFMVGLMALLYIFSTYICRIVWKHYLKSSGVSVRSRSLLVVTTSALAKDAIANIAKTYNKKYQLAGLVIVDSDMTGKEIEGVKVVANKDSVTEFVCRKWVDEVLISLPGNMALPHKLINDFVVMGVTVHLELGQSTAIEGTKQFIEELGNYTVLTTSMSSVKATELALKRMIDIAAGLVGCTITAFLYLILAPLIHFQSPGTVFFAQERVGKNGKKFKIYKFRSMYLDAEARKQELMEQNRVKDGLMFKLDFDPRIIGARQINGKTKKGLGNYIRDLSLDEFPQFYNILKGEMSLIGTRPPTIDEWEKYDLHHRARLATKPGLTGMWQVSGRSNITDFEEVVKLDKQYITNWSIGLDIKILLKTIVVVLKRDGSM